MFFKTVIAALMFSATAALAQDPPNNAELSRRIEILSQEIEKLKVGEPAAAGAGDTGKSRYGLSPSASKVYRAPRGVSIGGYGEMLYQNYSSQTDAGASAPSSSIDQIDFLRQIIYVGYRFNEKFLFNSEIEFEHAATDRPGGGAFVEFAYIDYLVSPAFNVRAGLLLLPVGLLNELHEPTIFLSARRPDVENLIIPSTWRENGVGIFGDIGPITYRSYLVNGLDASGFSSSGLRSGRQKGGVAKADSFSWVTRVDFVGVNGLLVGGSAYLGQSGYYPTTPGAFVNVPTRIYEAHIDWKWRGLEARALGVVAELDNVTDLNAAKALTGASSVGSRLTGSYVQLGYDVFANCEGDSALIPFVRWERMNTQDRVPDGFTSSGANSTTIMTYGAAFKPIEQIVVKFDYQDYKKENDSGVDQFNAALGYNF
jgi:hypothetical protein